MIIEKEMKDMREYQQEIINTIMKKLQQNVRKIFIEMPAGTGKSTVIRSLVKEFGTKKQILIMCKGKVLEQQFKDDLKDNTNIVICNYYNNILTTENFDYIILNSIEGISEKKYERGFGRYRKRRERA